MDRIYLDHAASTAMRPEVLEAMLPFFAGIYGNPSSVHKEGREARKAVEAARAQAAAGIGALPEEIVFTSGGTEADNLALRGAALLGAKRGKKHIITTAVEHHAVLHTAEELEKEGFAITYLPVDAEGLLTPAQVEAALTDDTALVSIMFANNEVGAIQPIAAIGAVCSARGVPFHTDAVQAVGAAPIDVKAMRIDLLSLSGHKLYGPKGVGALYMRKGLRLPAMITGGAHERGRRAGTENVPGIVGLGQAVALATADFAEQARIAALRDRLIDGLLSRIPDVKLNGPRGDKRLPNNVNVSIKYVEGEGMLLSLDMKGIAASSGSACTSGSLDPSHVLLAMGLDHMTAHGSLRLSLGRDNTAEQVEYVIDELYKIVERLRAMSPLFAQKKESAVLV